jgi:pyruvate dehydrogenase E2 component (dihydrolipoamide acetyltransferase)
MNVRMKMPDLSANEAEIKVIKWLIEPGQSVQRGQPLLEVETDKAVMEVESIAGGILRETRAAPETNVTVGQEIAVIEVTELPT